MSEKFFEVRQDVAEILRMPVEDLVAIVHDHKVMTAGIHYISVFPEDAKRISDRLLAMARYRKDIPRGQAKEPSIPASQTETPGK